MDSTATSIQVLVDFKDASYNGGGNITFKGTLEDDAYFKTRLFQGELPLADLPIYIAYSVKSDANSLLGLSLEFSSESCRRTSILLAYGGRPLSTFNQFASKFDKVIMPHRVSKLAREAQTASEWIIQESRINMNGYTLTEIHIVCYKQTHELNGLEPEEDKKSEGTKLARSPPEYYASLGHITIKTSDLNVDFPPSTSWIVEAEYMTWSSVSLVEKTLSVKIVWRLKNGGDSLFPKYIIYAEKQAKQGDSEVNEYLGVATVDAFYISNFLVPVGILRLKFTIQVCSVDGACQDLDSSPSFILDVEE